MTPEKIMQTLESDYNYLINRYGESRILGVFANGDINWGIDINKINTIDTAAVYLPTFEEMCFTRPTEEKDCIDRTMTNNSTIHLVDFRQIYESALDGRCFLTEALYAKYYICTKKYEDLYKRYLCNNRDKIVMHDKKARLNMLLEKSIDILHEVQTYALIPTTYNLTSIAQLLFKGIKFYKFSEAFASGKSYKESIENISDDIKNLLEIPDWLYKRPEDLNKLCTEYIKQAELLKVIVNYINNYEIDEEALYELKSAVLKIMKLADSNSEVCIDFLGKLTANERIALKEIYNSIGYEGNIAISKLVSNSTVSRAVYSSLIQKLEKYNVAEVKGCGTAGTYIKITEPSIIEKENI